MNIHQVQVPQGDLCAPTGKLCFTVQEACFSTGLSRSTIYLLMQDRKLRSIKVRNRTLIPADSLRGYLNSLEQEAA
ncbi:excisionase family DNA-binding protein [Methylobacterium sp. WL7]|uniref:excisionase family DNA-binding protein n=1 Tax=Methylobacterium sp. WL7 TaxID=2603900 RepID=UPI0011C7E193|nr:excisionase family DNA-binding protein [Methylobacterium sp. WL7]TXN41367.1 helix-turn-helix domain-containing protein [Methylobacterium sp. WL7]